MNVDMNPKHIREISYRITDAREALLEALSEADDVLQAENAPEPYDQWEYAIEAGQDAWTEVGSAGRITEQCGTVNRALRRMAAMLEAMASNADPL